MPLAQHGDTETKRTTPATDYESSTCTCHPRRHSRILQTWGHTAPVAQAATRMNPGSPNPHICCVDQPAQRQPDRLTHCTTHVMGHRRSHRGHTAFLRNAAGTPLVAFYCSGDCTTAIISHLGITIKDSSSTKVVHLDLGRASFCHPAYTCQVPRRHAARRVPSIPLLMTLIKSDTQWQAPMMGANSNELVDRGGRGDGARAERRAYTAATRRASSRQSLFSSPASRSTAAGSLMTTSS